MMQAYVVVDRLLNVLIIGMMLNQETFDLNISKAYSTQVPPDAKKIILHNTITITNPPPSKYKHLHIHLI
jgi:hypothetical protein